MRRRTKRSAVVTSCAGETGGPDIRALEMLLDYAMMEGAELRLPLFVLLLRTAQMELMTLARSGGGLHGRRHKPKVIEYLGAVEGRPLLELVPERCIEAARDELHGPQPGIHDR